MKLKRKKNSSSVTNTVLFQYHMGAAHKTLFLILTQEFTFSLQNLKNQSFQTLFDEN